MPIILALDIATTTGWALEFGGVAPLSGQQYFGGELGQFANAFEMWLEAAVKANLRDYVDTLAIEQPIVMTGRTTMATTCRLVGSYVIAWKVAWQHGLDVVTAPPSEWRKHFIGVGRAPKQVPESKRRAWLKERTLYECATRGWHVASEDAADALGLLSYVKHKLGVGACYSPGKPSISPSQPLTPVKTTKKSRKKSTKNSVSD